MARIAGRKELDAPGGRDQVVGRVGVVQVAWVRHVARRRPDARSPLWQLRKRSYDLLNVASRYPSFPLLLDRNVGVYAAVATSVRAVRENPGPMAAWGLIIAAGLVIGTLPLLVGLAIVLPILGHATWHLYRKVVG